MADLAGIKKILDNTLGVDLGVDPQCFPAAVVVQPGQLITACHTLLEHPDLYFDFLSCLTALDNGVEKGTMEVIYTLYSIPFNHSVSLKVTLPREKPFLPTVSTIWKAADWHEREAFDLLGVQFLDHPDLRRILLPADWEGFPLRKDYKHQEYYHGVKVEWTND